LLQRKYTILSKFLTVGVSDTHFGLSVHGHENPVTGLHTQTEDIFKAYQESIDYALKNKASLFIHSGDVFDKKVVNQTVVNQFYKQTKQLTDAGIPVVVLQGNHDASQYIQIKNGLDIAGTIGVDNFYVTRGGGIIDLDFVQIVTVSYWNGPEEVAEELNKYAKQVDWTRPAILVVHLQIEYADFPGAFMADLEFIPLAALTSHPWSFIQAGHIHKHQKLNVEPPAYYVGSLTRCNFAEEKDPKGFIAYEISGTKLSNIKFIEVDCRKYLTFKGTMSDLKSHMENSSFDFSKYIIKLIIDDANEPIDDAFIKEKFASAYKVIIQKDARRTTLTKIDALAGIGLEDYLNKYFEKDEEKIELLSLVKELRQLDEVKAVER